MCQSIRYVNSSGTVLHMTPSQCRMARAALQMGVRELATLAKVSPTTVAKLERGEVLQPRTVDAIRTALEAAGIEFIPENGGGPGARLRDRTK
jgi:transcriptional regulator with XRE-family HTH domain